MSKSSPLNGSCSESPRRAARIERALRNRETTAPDPVRDKVLYLGANPPGTTPLWLHDEVRAVKQELRGARHRCLELVHCWATEADDLVRELRESTPLIAHLGGHGCKTGGGRSFVEHGAASRDVVVDGTVDPAHEDGGGALVFDARDGRPHVVSYELVRKIFELAGASVKLVVLTACATEPLARLLLAHVDCVIGMDGPITDDVAAKFSRGLYAAIGDGASVEQAFLAGCVAIQCAGLPGADRPRLMVRDGVDASGIVLAGTPREHTGGPSRPGLLPSRRGKRGVQRGVPRRGGKLGGRRQGASGSRSKSNRARSS